MQIPEHYAPRDYQLEGLQALESGVSMAVFCWARRAGKDMTAFAYAVKKMVEQPMNVALVFPTKDQGKSSFWENIENDGWKTIDHIPKSLIARRDNSNMRIILKNGSTFQILGATDPEALRGANAKIYILSEMVDLPAAVLDIIRPIVAVNGGQIVMISTPKIDGISGATFKMYFDMAKKNPKWFSSLVTADKYLSAETLEELRQETIAKYGNDFLWRQEYLCDWGQVSSSSYFGGVLTAAKDAGRIADFPYNPSYPVYTAFDLGMSDSTAIVMFQYYRSSPGTKLRPRIIDYFETSDIGVTAIAAFVKSKPYNFGWHFFPHDGSVRDSDAVQRIQKYREAGLINSSLLIREPKDVGINRAVEGLQNTVFHEPTTTELVRKVLLYKRKFNPDTGDYVGPEHRTESHAADTVRYLFKAIDQMFDKETGEFLHSPVSSSDTYESEGFATPQEYRFGN